VRRYLINFGFRRPDR